MALPTLKNIVGSVTDFADRVESAFPVISSVNDSLKIASGKSTQPAPIQQPATVDSLVPRNVGQLDANVAGLGISGGAILMGVAVAAILFFAVKMKR